MRLIDAQSFSKDLMEEASFRTRKAYDDSSVAEARGLIRAFDLLKQQPTVDAVPVVRCGECRGWESEKRKIHKCDLCRMFGFEADDFCSKGKRKDREK